MDNRSYFCILTYAIMYVLIHQIIFRFYLLKYSLFFSSTLVLTSSIDVAFILSNSKTIYIPSPTPDFFLFTISSVIGLVWTFVHIPGMFLSTDFIFEKRIGVVIMGLLWIIFTYLAEDNQQESFRHSCNWIPLRCLGPWMNHLPPMWWSNFRFMFLNHSWCVNFI